MMALLDPGDDVVVFPPFCRSSAHALRSRQLTQSHPVVALWLTLPPFPRRFQPRDGAADGRPWAHDHIRRP